MIRPASIPFIRLGLAAAMMAAAVPAAHAAGTTAGTSITNTVLLDYEVGGVGQNQESAQVAFLVDRRIDVTVTADTGGLTVVPGAQDQVLEFTVTNLSNSTQDFALAADNDNNPADDFDSTGIQFFVESGANAGYQPAEDTATYIDELAADGAIKVYVVADIPLGLTDAWVANLTLTATAHQSTDLTGAYVATPGALAAASAETNTGSADDAAYIDTVFGDGTGETDGAEDGAFSATDSYIVETASMAIAKYSKVVQDPFNGTTNPKAIPGAWVEYCLIVTNSGSATATNIVLTDAIPANTAYKPDSIYTGATGTANTCDSENGTNQDDTTGPDGDYDQTTPGAVTVNAASVAGGGGVFRATFRVIINN